MKKLLSFICYLFFFMASWGQNSIGLSNVINYTTQIYSAGAQNWDIRQDKKGILYFGNNEGLLTFDGSYWKLYPLPNKTVVRSIEIGTDQKLYIGGQNEIGYFTPAANGELTYVSLVPLLPPEDRSFADVWSITSYGNNIFFRSSNKIMQFTGDKFSVYRNEDWRFMGVSKHELIAQNHENKLSVYAKNEWITYINQTALPKDFLITSIIPYSRDTSIVTTLKSGVYFFVKNILIPFNTPDLINISKKNIYKSLNIGNDRFLFATSLQGCFVTDKRGNLIQRLSYEEGLQNNNIRQVFLDKRNNLWLGLDNGIDFVAYNNAIKEIIPDKENIAAGYAAIVHNKQFYIGTANGLYSMPIDTAKNLSSAQGSFKLVPNSQGQVWCLAEVNGELLMGHHEGSFVINNNTAEVLDNSSGFWNFFPLHQQPSNIMLAGNYRGVNFYTYENGKFNNPNIGAHFESSRIIALDEDNIWVAHPYKGIYKINFNPPANATIQKYTHDKGLASLNHYYVYKVKGKIIVPTENGFFEYNSSADNFRRSEFFENIFGSIKTNFLKEDQTGNIWFTSEKNLGVVDLSEAVPKIIYITELKGKFVRGFEFIYPFNAHNILVGGEKGFFDIDFEQYRKNNNSIEVLIRSVKASNQVDSLIYGGYGEEKTGSQELVYNLNSLHFEYSSVLYGQQLNIEYSYWLKGFDKTWSDWSKRTDKEYINLPPGNYTFQVKARNNLGNESEISKYSFTILPPWYRSRLAYLISILLFIIGNYLFFIFLKRKFKAQQSKHEQEQKRLQYLHQLEIEKTDREIVKLKNEKLEAEIQHKNNELASVAMHLVQKGELLSRIKDQMVRLKNHSESEKNSEDLKKIINVIKEENKIDKQWEQFTVHFDNVHSNFHTALKSKHPNLSPNELKLAAYLRMDLTTKEIARLMNISIRGVEVSRYRLRKKLCIPTEISLNNFLSQITD